MLVAAPIPETFECVMLHKQIVLRTGLDICKEALCPRAFSHARLPHCVLIVCLFWPIPGRGLCGWIWYRLSHRKLHSTSVCEANLGDLLRMHDEGNVQWTLACRFAQKALAEEQASSLASL